MGIIEKLKTLSSLLDLFKRLSSEDFVSFKDAISVMLSDVAFDVRFNALLTVLGIATKVTETEADDQVVAMIKKIMESNVVDAFKQLVEYFTSKKDNGPNVVFSEQDATALTVHQATFEAQAIPWALVIQLAMLAAELLRRRKAQ